MSSPATGSGLDGPGPATAAAANKQTEGNGKITAALDISQYGPSEVYHPPDGQAVLVDIVFVHGLMGHPIKTWLHGREPKHNPGDQDDGRRSRLFSKLKRKSSRAASPSTQNHCYWPLLLGQELKCARIITYGYNSKPFSFLGIQPPPGQMTIEELATNLMQSIAARRRGHEGRPLIFIAHSLGGILVKSALVESTKVRPDIADSCVAIFFFGTPHSGSAWAEKGGYVANIIKVTCMGSFKTQVLKGLSRGSETLTRITKDFNDLLVRAQKPVPRHGICTFMEGTGASSWGVTERVVDNTSSRYNRRDVEQEFTIQGANHMDMCRFESRKNRDYQQVVSFLEEYLDKIREEINQEEVRAAAEAAQTAERETEEKRVQAKKEATVLIEALDYDHRLVKDQYINRRPWAPESLDWIWDSEFGTWLSSPEPIFWISGKPGSGKSTLTSYIAHSPQLVDRLEAAAAPSSKFLVLLHFFNYQLRQELGNNFAGLLRSLLHGLLDKVPEFVSALRKELNLPDSADKAKTWVLNTGQVQSALLWSMRAVVEKDQTLVLFIDGLDELDQTHQWQVSRFIQELKCFESGRVKICLSSRNIPPFSEILLAHPTLLVSERNHLAIQSWAEGSLNLIHDIADIKSLAEKIATKSEGVFLWAHFAVEEALRLISEGYGRDQEKMEAMLLDQPQELKGIYSRIIQRIREEDRTGAGVYFSLVLGYKSTNMSLSRLYEASTLAIKSYREQMTYRSGRPKTEGAHQHIDKQTVTCDADLTDFWRRVLSVCGGMIVASQIGVKEYPTRYSKSLNGRRTRANNIKVGAMHRTVQEYFGSGTGWRELFGDGVDVQEWIYEPWVRACFAFLRAPLTWSHDVTPAPNDWSSSDDSDSSDDDDMPAYDRNLEIFQQSLAEYVSSNLGEHLFEYEEAMRRSFKLFAYDVPFDEYLKAHKSAMGAGYRTCCCLYFPPKMTWDLELQSDMQFAISYGLILYIQDCLEHPDEADMMSIQDIFAFAAHCSIAEIDSHQRSRQTAVLSFLVEYAKRKNKPIRPLDDFVMYQVLRFSHVEVVKICLETFPKGPIVLRPPYFEGCKCLSAFQHRRCKIIFYEDRQPVEYTPFHPLARNLWGMEKNGPIAQLLLERGESIKALCGPEGNVIHAELEFHASVILGHHALQNVDESFCTELWIEFGADIHGENSEGLNPLEFFWKRVSEAELSSISGMREMQINAIRTVIRTLLELGAVNRTKDTNGRVPDVETMKNFAEDLLPDTAESSMEDLLLED